MLRLPRGITIEKSSCQVQVFVCGGPGILWVSPEPSANPRSVTVTNSSSGTRSALKTVSLGDSVNGVTPEFPNF